MLRYDSIMLAVGDPMDAASWLRKEFGLGCTPSVAHQGGLGSVLVPLKAPQYLQLLYVRDPGVAWRHAWGRMMGIMGRSRLLVGWSVRVDSAAEAGKRLGVDPVELGLDGGKASLTVSDPFCLGSLPILVEHRGDDKARAAHWEKLVHAAGHAKAPPEIAWVKISEEEDRLDEWIGRETKNVRRCPGQRALHAVGLRGPDGGEFVLESA